MSRDKEIDFSQSFEHQAAINNLVAETFDSADASGGEIDRGAHLWGTGGGAGLDLLGRHPDRGFRQLDPVEPAGEVENRRKAIGLHRGEHVRHRPVDIGLAAAVLGQEGVELGLELSIGRAEAAHGGQIATQGAIVTRRAPHQDLRFRIT